MKSLAIVKEAIELTSMIMTNFKPFKKKAAALTPVTTIEDIEGAMNQLHANRLTFPQVAVIIPDDQSREDKRLSRSPHSAEIAGSTPAPATKKTTQEYHQRKMARIAARAKARDEEKAEVPKPTNVPLVKPIPYKVGVACLPCTVSHMATVAGQLSEAIRFARKDLTDREVTIRVDNAMKEIANVERIDLAPEKLVDLPEKERELANSAAAEIRDIRHGLEYFESADDLEKIAAQAANLQHKVNHAWTKIRLLNRKPQAT